eukprot:TRINITY_DN3832_c1_g1_i4.p1 TRINITY_DN3832_c1_g1~~TRINITY_DN3832_c1_g1_i4.p1  ORF type:complete len:661 (-),score=122.42 TRINITY_DN3832_c1_g1_i4:69-1988(-)
MAQMRALEKQKEKAEIEIQTLEKIQAEMRPLMQRTFEQCSKTFVVDVTTVLKRKIAAEINGRVTSVLRDLGGTLTNDIVTGMSTELKGLVKLEMERQTVQNADLQNADLQGDSKSSRRSMVRSNLSDRLVARRKAIRGKTSQPKHREVSRENTEENISSARGLLQSERENSSRSDAPTSSRGSESSSESCLTNAVLSNEFESVFCAVTMMSTVIIGFRTDYSIRYSGDPPVLIRWLELISMFAFLIEIILKIYVNGISFFTGEQYLWNRFDFTMVVFQVTEEAVSVLASSASKAFSLQPLRAMRILRVFRVTRLLRLVRVWEDMRLIIDLLTTSLRPLLGALFVLSLVFFFASIAILEAILYRQETVSREHVHNQLPEFDTLLQTMLSLFQSITGGMVWGPTAERLAEDGVSFIMPSFCLLIGFCIFGMCNILTGVFVGQTIASAQDVQDELLVQQIHTLFVKKGDNGTISFNRYKEIVDYPEMAAVFKSINIDKSEAKLLFKLLDDNNDGVLDYDEFINSALRLRGPAKSLEFAMFAKETTAENNWTKKQIGDVERLVALIVDRLDCDGAVGKAQHMDRFPRPSALQLVNIEEDTADNGHGVFFDEPLGDLDQPIGHEEFQQDPQVLFDDQGLVASGT